MVPAVPRHEAEPFHVRVEPGRDQVRVIPAGELDIATVAELDGELRRLIEAGVRNLVLDLRELTFLDSTGLRLVLALDAHARRDGMTLVLVSAQPSVRRVFEVAGVLERLPFDRP